MLEESSTLYLSGLLGALNEWVFPGVHLDSGNAKDELVDEVETSVGGFGNEQTYLDEEEIDGDLEEVKDEDDYECVEGRITNLNQDDLTTK